MYSRKYVNLVEIGTVVLEIQKAEFGNFTVPVNNTLVCLASSFVFLAADTLLCVLILTNSNSFRVQELCYYLHFKINITTEFICICIMI